jgi:hypothetical protein
MKTITIDLKSIEICNEVAFAHHGRYAMNIYFNADEETEDHHWVKVSIPRNKYPFLCDKLVNGGEPCSVSGLDGTSITWSRTNHVLVASDMLRTVGFVMMDDDFEALHQAILEVLGKEKFSGGAAITYDGVKRE